MNAPRLAPTRRVLSNGVPSSGVPSRPPRGRWVLDPRIRLTLTALALLAGATACSDDDGPTEPPPDPDRLILEISYVANGQPLALDTGRYLAASGDSFSVANLRHYVSNVTLLGPDLRRDGAPPVTVVADSSLRYVDAKRPASLRIALDGVTADSFSRLSFLIGLDDAHNRLGGIEEPTVDDLVMEWPIPLGGGYHNIQLEGFYWRGADTRQAYNVHLGRAQENPSQGTPYINHSIEIAIDDPAVTTIDGIRTIRLQMEIDEWFRTPHVYDFATWGFFIMDRHEPQQILRENAADAFVALP